MRFAGISLYMLARKEKITIENKILEGTTVMVAPKRITGKQLYWNEYVQIVDNCITLNYP